MGDDAQMTFYAEQGLLSIHKDGCGYYYKLLTCGLVGPFKDEIEVYQNAIEDFSKIFVDSLTKLGEIEQRLKEVMEIIEN